MPLALADIAGCKQTGRLLNREREAESKASDRRLGCPSSSVRVTLNSLCPSLHPINNCVWLLNMYQVGMLVPALQDCKDQGRSQKAQPLIDTCVSDSLSISLSGVSRSRSVRVYLQDCKDQGRGGQKAKPVIDTWVSLRRVDSPSKDPRSVHYIEILFLLWFMSKLFRSDIL